MHMVNKFSDRRAWCAILKFYVSNVFVLKLVLALVNGFDLFAFLQISYVMTFLSSKYFRSSLTCILTTICCKRTVLF